MSRTVHIEEYPRGTEQRVDVAYINEQRRLGWPDIHPEDYCHRCGNRNTSWWVDSTIWNAIMESALSPHHGIICPSCFGNMFEALWPHTSWELRLSNDTRGAKAFLHHTRHTPLRDLIHRLQAASDARRAHRLRNLSTFCRKVAGNADNLADALTPTHKEH